MKTPSNPNKIPQRTLYTLEVFLISGPVSEAFIEQNPEISRTIEIRGEHTLETLHRAIFDAFDREDEHMYEFQIGGKGPQDPHARQYVSDRFDDSAAGHVSQTRLDAVGLQEDDAFGYWFDYGDDWWHQINVLSITEPVPNTLYPKVTKRVGASPPEYEE